MRIYSLDQPARHTNTLSVSELLGRLNIGDVIKAQVIEATSNELLLKLADGTLFTAATHNKHDTLKGEFVRLMVNGKNSGQVFMEIIKDKNNLNDNTGKIPIKDGFIIKLLPNGNEPKEQNTLTLSQLVSERLKIGDQNGDVVRAQVIEATSNELLLKFPDGTLLTAAATLNKHEALKGEFVRLMENGKNSGQVFMEVIKDKSNLNDNSGRTPTQDDLIIKLLSNGIEPKEQNISMLSQLASGKIRIGDQLGDLLKIFERTVKSEEQLALLKKDIDSLFVKISQEGFANNNEAAVLNIKNNYKKILTVLEQLKLNTSKSSLNISDSLAITKHIDSLENNLKFIDVLSNYDTYIQVPLNVNDNKTTAEIYILKRGHKKRRIDPENSSILISLNTHNIGLVESLISINKKSISINMRVEDEEIIDFFKENYRHLFNSFSHKGYKLADIRYSIIKKKANVLSFAEELRNEFSETRNTIDYRI